MLQAVSVDSMGKTTVANPGDNGVQAFTQVPVEGYTVSTATDCEVSISGLPVGVLMTQTYCRFLIRIILQEATLTDF